MFNDPRIVDTSGSYWKFTDSALSHNQRGFYGDMDEATDSDFVPLIETGETDSDDSTGDDEPEENDSDDSADSVYTSSSGDAALDRSSQYIGVQPDDDDEARPWRAICCGLHLGTFATEKEAALEYDTQARRMPGLVEHGVAPACNFPEGHSEPGNEDAAPRLRELESEIASLRRKLGRYEGGDVIDMTGNSDNDSEVEPSSKRLKVSSLRKLQEQEATARIVEIKAERKEAQEEAEDQTELAGQLYLSENSKMGQIDELKSQLRSKDRELEVRDARISSLEARVAELEGLSSY